MDGITATGCGGTGWTGRRFGRWSGFVDCSVRGHMSGELGWEEGKGSDDDDPQCVCGIVPPTNTFLISLSLFGEEVHPKVDLVVYAG